MTVQELTRDQLSELKAAYIIELANEGERPAPSWAEMAFADLIITDEEIFDRYAGTCFVDEDFACSGALPGIDY